MSARGPIKEAKVANPVDALILDLLEWIGPRPRAYSEVIEAWRTSCPRLPVWEEACAQGFVERQHTPGAESLVSVTDAGKTFLRRRRPERAIPN